MKQTVLDIETAGTEPGCIVFSAGIVTFDDAELQSFEEIKAQGIEIIFNTKVQVEAGLKVSQSTMEWWAQQGADAQRVINPPDEVQVHPREFYGALTPLGDSYTLSKLKWIARGPTFDMVILQMMLAAFNVSVPWRYWNVRDSRTIYDEHNVPYNVLPMPKQSVAHNALDDAVWDAWMIQRLRNDRDELVALEEQFALDNPQEYALKRNR